jgi:hypothetical protein
MSDSYDGPEYGEFAWESVTELEPEGDGTFEITVRLRDIGRGTGSERSPDAPRRRAGARGGHRRGRHQLLGDRLRRPRWAGAGPSGLDGAAARAADAEAQRQQAVADDMAITFRRLAGFPPEETSGVAPPPPARPQHAWETVRNSCPLRSASLPARRLPGRTDSAAARGDDGRWVRRVSNLRPLACEAGRHSGREAGLHLQIGGFRAPLEGSDSVRTGSLRPRLAQ